MEWPTLTEFVGIAPVASISCGLIYFGWWIRGESVRILEREVEKRDATDAEG